MSNPIILIISLLTLIISLFWFVRKKSAKAHMTYLSNTNENDNDESFDIDGYDKYDRELGTCNIDLQSAKDLLKQRRSELKQLIQNKKSQRYTCDEDLKKTRSDLRDIEHRIKKIKIKN